MRPGGFEPPTRGLEVRRLITKTPVQRLLKRILGRSAETFLSEFALPVACIDIRRWPGNGRNRPAAERRASHRTEGGDLRAELSIGAELDPVIWVDIGLLVAGGLLAAGSALAITAGIRRRGR